MDITSAAHLGGSLLRLWIMSRRVERWLSVQLKMISVRTEILQRSLGRPPGMLAHARPPFPCLGAISGFPDVLCMLEHSSAPKTDPYLLFNFDSRQIAKQETNCAGSELGHRCRWARLDPSACSLAPSFGSVPSCSIGDLSFGSDSRRTI